jgi:hypothetical protein
VFRNAAWATRAVPARREVTDGDPAGHWRGAISRGRILRLVAGLTVIADESPR